MTNATPLQLLFFLALPCPATDAPCPTPAPTLGSPQHLTCPTPVTGLLCPGLGAPSPPPFPTPPFEPPKEASGGAGCDKA